jgi:hypothetical protein
MLLCGFLRVPFAQQTAGGCRHLAFPAPFSLVFREELWFQAGTV